MSARAAPKFDAGRVRTMVLAGMKAPAIAEVLGLRLNTLVTMCSQHQVTLSLRRAMGNMPSQQIHKGEELLIWLRKDEVQLLRKAAKARALTEEGLASLALKWVIRGELYDAVIDGGD